MELPQGWVNCSLSDVSEIIAGQSPESKYYNENGDGLPFFQGKTDFGHLYPTNRIYCTVPKKLAENGDILLSVRAPVGPTNLSRETVAIGRGIHAIRPLGDILTSYVLYYFKQIEPVFSGTGTGTTFSAVTVDDVKNLKFPLSPLAEQQRIVKKIDALFSKLDKGVEMLQTIRQQVQTYRQAVLKWAFAGYEFDLEPLLLHVDSIFDGPFGSNLKTSDYVDSGIRVVRLENIKATYFFDDRKSFVTEEKYKLLQRNTVKFPDIVMSTFISKEVKACIIPKKINFAVNKADCVCIRTQSLLDSKFVMYYLSTRNVYNGLFTQIHGATRPRVNTTQIKKIPVPKASVEEKHKIVTFIESRLSVCDKLEALVDENLAKADALRQSILKKAFAGQLVPQDLADEPAEKLLERIKAERQAPPQHQNP